MNENRADNFLDFIRLWRLTDSYETIQRTVLSVYCGLLILASTILYKKSMKKIARIKRRDVDIPHAELDTYSSLSYYILLGCKFQLLSMMLLAVINLILLNAPKFNNP